MSKYREAMSQAQTAGAAISEPQMDMHIAAEHYGEGYNRGLEAGRFKENRRIIELLRSEEGRDWVWNNWKGERELYNLLEELITHKDVKTILRRPSERVKVDIPGQKARREQAEVEAELNG